MSDNKIIRRKTSAQAIADFFDHVITQAYKKASKMPTIQQVDDMFDIEFAKIDKKNQIKPQTQKEKNETI